MSGNTADALRWVLYGGEYYAALLMSRENAPTEVPEGHVFVYFLGEESGCSVLESDVFPYDPNDEEKCKNPAAATGVAVAASLLQPPTSSSNDVTLGDLLDMDMEEDNEENSSGKKKKEKKEKKKKTHVKQELEESDSDGDHHSRTRRRQRQDEEDAQDEDELLLGNSKRKEGKNRSPLLEDLDDEEEEDEEEAAQLDENDDNARWRNMEAAAGLRDTHVKRGSHASAFEYMSSASRLNQSPITPFISRIRSVYQRLAERARLQNKILDLSEYQVLAAIESKMRSTEAKVAFLKRALSDSSSPSEVGNDDTDATVNIESAIHRLQEDATDVDQMVSDLVQIVAPPHLRSEISRAEHDRRHPEAAEDNFVDPTTDHIYRRRTYAHAPLEPSPQEKVNKYFDQRRRLEQQQQYSSYSQRNNSLRSGLLGRSNEIKVMEEWNKSRALLAIAPIQESQLVKPEGYFAAKYSSSKSRLEEAALRRLTRGKVSNSNVAEDDDDAMAWYRKQTQKTYGDGPNGAPVLYHFHEQQYLPAGATSIGGGVTMGKGTEEMRYMGINATNPTDQNFSGMGSITAGGAASLYLSQYSEDVTLASPDAPQGGPLAPAGILPRLEVPGYEKPELLFKVDPEEDVSKKKIFQYSMSMALPSQESVYSDVESGDDGERKHRLHRHRSRSRHSSRANSVDPDEEGKRHSTSSIAGGETKKRSWRDNAKRAVLEQLTLYYKGIKGKPRVLDEADFKRIAALLLERATQAESERSKRSLKLEVNNRTVPFTKEMEKKLKKSVDSYIQRHFAAAIPESAISTTNLTTAPVVRDTTTRRPGQINLPQPSMPETALDGQEEAPLTYQ